MVAKTPLIQRKLIVAPLSPTFLRQTVHKVDQCMERLQELQYIVNGGNKVIGGVKLSPTSTKAYFKTSLRCKQESLIRVRNNGTKRSPTGKAPASLTGEWRRMSLASMLVGETVAEILQTSKFTQEIMGSSSIDDPKTPLLGKQKPKQESTPIETRRKREKQHRFRVIQAESVTPSMKRARSRINFKVSPPKKSEIEKHNVGFCSTSYYMTSNKVSPKHKPWSKKTVLFPNPLFHSSPTSQRQNFCKTKSPMIAKRTETSHKFLFHSSPTSQRQNFCKTKSPMIAKRTETPHKFLVKSPVKINKVSPKHTSLYRKSPPRQQISTAAFKVTPQKRFVKSPPRQQLSTAGKLRRSLSPSRLVARLVSPLKGRRSSMVSSCDLRQKTPALMMMPMRFSTSRGN